MQIDDEIPLPLMLIYLFREVETYLSFDGFLGEEGLLFFLGARRAVHRYLFSSLQAGCPFSSPGLPSLLGRDQKVGGAIEGGTMRSVGQKSDRSHVVL